MDSEKVGKVPIGHQWLIRGTKDCGIVVDQGSILVPDHIVKHMADKTQRTVYNRQNLESVCCAKTQMERQIAYARM